MFQNYEDRGYQFKKFSCRDVQMQLRNSFNQPNYDPFLLWIIIILSGVGLVMVYSSSIDVAALKQISKYQNYYYLLRHSIYLTISIFCGLIAFLIPINFWQKFAPTFFVFGILLLIAVLVPGIGKTVNGSQRWIPIGIMNFQPSELVKLFTIIYAADYVLRKSRQIGTFIRGLSSDVSCNCTSGFITYLST